VIVVAGDGVGEYVPISSYDPTTGVITLAGSWAALPDATSVIRVSHIVDNITVYDNTLQGKGVTNTASVGVQFWGAAINCIVDSNTISNTRYGINDVSQDTGGVFAPSYFDLFQNNSITNTEAGFWIGNNGSSNLTGNVGSVFRFNDINGLTPGFAAFLLRDGEASGSPLYLIIEGNAVTGAPVALEVADSGTTPIDLTLSDNSFTLGAAAYADSIGFEDLQPLVLTEAGNTFTGFADADEGTFTPTILLPTAGPSVTELPSLIALEGLILSQDDSGSDPTVSPDAISEGGSNIATGGSNTASNSTTTTESSSGKSKPAKAKQSSKNAPAAAAFAAVPTTKIDKLKIDSARPKNDADVLAA